MKKIIIMFIAFNLMGCAAMEHSRIADRQAQLSKERGIPDYGVNNRNNAAVDAVHGAAWWVGTRKAHEELNKILKR